VLIVTLSLPNLQLTEEEFPKPTHVQTLRSIIT
jgi:hypothetical protein